jgi:hypothetical protein
MMIAEILSDDPDAPVYLMRCRECINDCPKAGKLGWAIYPDDCVRIIAAQVPEVKG